MMRREPQWRVFAGLAVLALAGLAPFCVRANAQQHSSPAPETREVMDETGRRVAVPVMIRRIVSIAPNLTETIYALGAQDRLVGDTDYCDYPPEAKQKPHVGGALNPSLEAVVALKPDLVLATTAINRRATVEALERLGVAVYATDPRTVEGVLQSMRTLSALIGGGQQADALAAQLQTRLADLRARLAGDPPRRALFVVWVDPFISIGPRTFLADALRWAGAESVVRAKGDWPQVSLEEVVRLDPEYLVFAEADHAAGESEFEELKVRPGWRALRAVKERHIAIVSDALNRPAPRMIDAIEELAKQLHPELFQPKADAEKLRLETREEALPPRAFWFSRFEYRYSRNSS
jgi:iron complex transport system substrate-binding protein